MRYLFGLIALIASLWGTLHFFAESQKSEFKALSGSAMQRAEVFKQAGYYKTMLTEFYMSNGHFPESLDELGASHLAQFGSSNFQRLKIEPGGVLHFSYQAGDGDEVEYLFIPEILEGGGMIPISWQCQSRGDEELLEAMPDSLCAHVDGDFVLNVAEEKEAAPVVITAEDLLEAVKRRNQNRLRYLISQQIDLDQLLPNNKRALTMVTEEGDVQYIRILMKADASVDYWVSEEQGFTFLMLLAGQSNVPQRLFKEVASQYENINERDSEGRTALIHAAKADNTNGIRALLELDADSTLRDYQNRRAFEYAVMNGTSSGSYRVLSAERDKKNEFIYLPSE